MKAKENWDRHGWPWELEAVIFFTYAATVAVPFFFPGIPVPDTTLLFPDEQKRVVEEYLAQDAVRDRQDVTWIIAVTLVYLVHLFVRWRSPRHFSIPLVQLFTPTLMVMILYLRLLTQPVLPGGERILVDGSLVEALTFFFAALAITVIVARIRMFFYMRNFQGAEWDLTTPARFDRTFWRLVPQVTPALYPARVYHTFSEGIVVEGWLYTMAIPFELLQNVRIRGEDEPLASGLVLATSQHHMVELALKDTKTHIMISPVDYDAFYHYVLQREVGLREEVGHPHPIILKGKEPRRIVRKKFE